MDNTRGTSRSSCPLPPRLATLVHEGRDHEVDGHGWRLVVRNGDLPLMYLHGLSTSDSAPALEQFLGTGHGLSAATITRLTEQWKRDATKFGQRSLKDVDYVYL